jgi:uncharacterized membrane protein
MTDWSIDPVGGPWAWAAAACALLPLIAVGPRTEQLTSRRRIALTALRLGSLVLILAVMLRPALETIIQKQLPGTVLLLFDRSRSMSVEDSLAGKSRWAALRETLETVREPLQILGTGWDLRCYTFADDLQPIDIEEGRLVMPEEATGGQTAIGAALENAVAKESQQRIMAVLLLSDGAQRAFAPYDLPPQSGAQRLASDGIPLWTFTFGKPALGKQSDLRISDLLASDVVFADAPMTVEATLTSSGYANQNAKVQLRWESTGDEMTTLDTQIIALGSGRQRYPVTLETTPEEPGEYKLTVEVEAPEGELVTSNNRQSTFVTVRKGGMKILYLAGAARPGGGPSPEPRFLRAALAAHADLNLQYELINYRRPKTDYRDRLREEKHDVYLLGNLDASALSLESWLVMADRVKLGAGLAMLGGLHSFGPGGFRETALDSVLPIQMGPAERQRFGEPLRKDMHVLEPVRMIPVVRGTAIHPILRVAPSNQDLAAWRGLPALDGANRFDRLRLAANANVIAEADNASRSPLLVLGAWGDGRTAALAVDSTWYWQLGGFRDLHRRFWRQLILWLGKKDGVAEQRVWVRLDQRRYQQGSRVDFSLGANDEEGQPLEQVEFDVRVELPDGTAQTVPTLARTAEHTGSFSSTSSPGDYRLLVTARANGTTVGDATARWSVSDQDIELDQPAAEPSLMAAMAARTKDVGGGAFAPEELPQVLAELQEKSGEFQEELVERITLWDRWPTLLTLVGVLSAEWFLRKRWGLV